MSAEISQTLIGWNNLSPDFFYTHINIRCDGFSLSASSEEQSRQTVGKA